MLVEFSWFDWIAMGVTSLKNTTLVRKWQLTFKLDAHPAGRPSAHSLMEIGRIPLR
jgi:hypothetical protein